MGKYGDNQGRKDGGFNYSSSRNRKKRADMEKAGVMVLGSWK